MTELDQVSSKKNNMTFSSKQLEAFSRVYHSSYLNALQPLLNALQWHASERYLFESLPQDLSHLSCYDLLHTMELLYYEYSSFDANLKNIDYRFFPCLFVRQDKKVFVLIKEKDENLTIYDCQERMEKTFKLSELNWRGKVYIFKQKEIKNVETTVNVSWFSSILTEFKPLALLIVIINFLLNLLSLAIPIFIMVVYDRVIIANSISTLIGISIGVIIAIMAISFLQKINNNMMAYLGAKLDIIANNDIMRKIYSLPLPYLESAPINVQIAKVKGFDSIRNFFTGQTVDLILNFVFSLIFIFAIWLIAGYLVWIPLVTIAVSYFCSFILWGYFKKIIKITNQLSIEEQDLWLEILVNIRAIKYVNSEALWFKRFREKSAELSFSYYRLNITNNMINSLFDTITTLSAISTLGFGVIGIINHQLSIGSLLATMILLWRVLNPIKSLYIIMSKLDQVKLNINQVNSLMSLESEDIGSSINEDHRIKGYVNINNLSFRYNQKQDPALLGISFKADPNNIIALTGPSGCGKSTLLKLIIGLYQAQMGTIQLDGYDIRQLNIHEVRYQVSYIANEMAFFNGTIEQNLRLAKPNATFEEINQALKLAHVYEDIMKLANGVQSTLKKYDRPILSTPVLLKLAFARAFLKNSSLILINKILDRLEPNEKKLMLESINKIKHNRTIIISTSDYLVLNEVNRIVFLDRGRILVDGPADIVLKDKNLQPYYQGIV